MKRKSLTHIDVVILFVLIGITNGFAQVTGDFDKNTDFSKFKTYTFKGWEKDSDKEIPEFDKKRILDAFAKELTSRGMSHIEGDGGDLAITLYVVVDKKTSTTAYSTYTGGYGYYGRWGWGGGIGSVNTSYTTDDYLEGTLVVDFYDQSTKELAWQGVLRSVVKEKPKQREKSIPKKIKKLMAKYPVKAAR